MSAFARRFRSLLLVLLLTVGMPAAAQQSIVDRFEVRSQAFDGLTLGYRLFVPDDYDPERAYPLVLALHGAGERGVDNEVQIRLHRLATSWADPVNQARHPTFVVAPQVPPGARWSAEQPVASSDITAVERTTLDILDSLAVEFNIDPDRVYVTGLSMGGHGTWDLIARRPHRFAAAVPMSGRGDPDAADRFLHLPVWAFHGESDTVVRPSGSRRVVQALEDLGRDVLYTDCRRSPPLATNFACPGTISTDSLRAAIGAHADLIFTSVRNGGHGPWTVWYDHPLLPDWLFSKVRVDPDALTLDAPAREAVWSGIADVRWSSPHAPADTVEVWFSPDDGATWTKLGETPLGEGRFAVDTAARADAALARVRLFVRNADGRVYGRTTSAPFTVDNDGDAPPTLAIDDEALRFDPEITAAAYTLDVRAADPERSPLAAQVFYSIDGGATFAEAAAFDLVSSPDSQPLTLDVARLPNATEAQFRVSIDDGAHSVSATTPVFVKRTERVALGGVEHIAGEGNGTVVVHVVEPDRLTGHRYRITFDASGPAAKTYRVDDLDAGVRVLEGVPLSDGLRESPVFDGLTLVVQDLEEGMPDLEQTGWTVGDTDLGVQIAGGEVRIAVLRVRLLATETAYALTLTEAVADTSVARYAIPARPLLFTVTGRDDGLRRRVVFDDENGDGRPGDGDVLYILEPAPAGGLEPAWELRFSATDATVPPEPGDTFVFVPLSSLGPDDVFEVVGRIGVAVEAEEIDGEIDGLTVYPNPFREGATAAFRLTRPGTVTLDLFDVLGRRVARLAEGPAAAGEHRVRWDTGRKAGRTASGVYILRLTMQPFDGGPPRVLMRSVVRAGSPDATWNP